MNILFLIISLIVVLLLFLLYNYYETFDVGDALDPLPLNPDYINIARDRVLELTDTQLDNYYISTNKTQLNKFKRTRNIDDLFATTFQATMDDISFGGYDLEFNSDLLYNYDFRNLLICSYLSGYNNEPIPANEQMLLMSYTYELNCSDVSSPQIDNKTTTSTKLIPSKITTTIPNIPATTTTTTTMPNIPATTTTTTTMPNNPTTTTTTTIPYIPETTTTITTTIINNPATTTTIINNPATTTMPNNSATTTTIINNPATTTKNIPTVLNKRPNKHNKPKQTTTSTLSKPQTTTTTSTLNKPQTTKSTLITSHDEPIEPKYKVNDLSRNTTKYPLHYKKKHKKIPTTEINITPNSLFDTLNITSAVIIIMSILIKINI